MQQEKEEANAVSRNLWPATLAELMEEPVLPHCPEACCWRMTCPTHVQLGVSPIFRKGEWDEERPEAHCPYSGRLAQLLRQETGCEAPGSPAELRELLAERVGMQEEAAHA